MKTMQENGRVLDAFVGALLGTVVTLTGSGAAEAATPSMFNQSANLSGSGNTINVTRVPVRDVNGNITYKDIVLQFNVNTAGDVTLAATYPKITPSPILNIAGFRAGVYKDSLGRHVRVSGPSVLSGGRTSWAIEWIDPASGYYFNASWATGPVTGHPNEATLKAAGITTTPYSWGIVGSNYGFLGGWNNGTIIGAAQLGDTLNLHYFGYDTKEDASWVMTRCVAGNLC